MGLQSLSALGRWPHQPPAAAGHETGLARAYDVGFTGCRLTGARAQVDVTAAPAAPAPGVAPTPDASAASTQMVGMAVKQMTAGWTVSGDVWAGIKAGVARLKPHKAQVRRANAPCHSG